MSDPMSELLKRETRSFLVGRDPSIDRRDRPRPEKRTRLFDEGDTVVEDDYEMSEEEEYDTDDDEFTTDETTQNTADNSQSNNSAQIYLRLRPVQSSTPTYLIGQPNNVLIVKPFGESTSNNKNMMEKHYSFSSIFDVNVEQNRVYEMCVRQSIQNEESFTVFTYGTSGSGKTYTLLGDINNPGIVPRSLENIFTMYKENIYPSPSIKMLCGTPRIQDDDSLVKDIKRREQIFREINDSQCDYVKMQAIVCTGHDFMPVELSEVSVLIWISFVEIYNENIIDLLAPLSNNSKSFSSKMPTTKNLKIVGNDGKVFINGVTTIYVKDSWEALKLLHHGLQRVNYASTSINSRSSRSHCIFMVDVIKYSSNSIVSMSYKFCDLAGSERVEKTGNVGHRLNEAKRINTSLMILGRCLDAANANASRKKPDVIPYRESKLTMLLQAALLGKEKLCMVVNVTPMDKFYEENLTVLNFSSIAKNIIFKRPPMKQKKSRFSFLMSTINSNSSESSIRKLLDEKNLELERVKLLLEEGNMQHLSEIENLQLLHQQEILKQEQVLRNQLVDSFQVTLKQRENVFDRRLQHNLNDLKASYEAKIAKLTREYENKLEDVREELEDAREELEEMRGELKELRKSNDAELSINKENIENNSNNSSNI